MPGPWTPSGIRGNFAREMKLYGSIPSPFVRRVRIIALELGISFELVDTMTAAGQTEMRARSPIWKVPCADLDGSFIVDSHVIVDELIRRHGGPLPRESSLHFSERNRLNFVDTALDSLLQRFYLLRDGVSPEVPHIVKQVARAESAFAALEANLPPDEPLFSHFSLALTTAIDWLAFRSAYPIEKHTGLIAFRDRVSERPSFAATRPE